MNQVISDLYAALKHQEPSRTPVVIWGPTAPFDTTFVGGVNEKDYYLDASVKLATQTTLLKAFPEAVGLPGLWPDFGAVGLPSTMGCPLTWLEGDAPVARPMMDELEDVKKLKLPDVTKDGCLAIELQQWEYFWKHADRDFIEEYGYLDGCAYVLGPVETAGLMRGYTNFFLDMYYNPKLVHELLEINTETAINYLHECEKINGKMKRLAVGDHVPAQISPAHFQEYWLPYMSRIFKEFYYADIRLWHNEGLSQHVFPYLKDLGANAWHFGDDSLQEAKLQVGQHLCLMGNVHAVNSLVNGNYDSVMAAAQDVIQQGSKGGGLWLSSGGGMAPHTPKANIQALIDATKG